MRTHLLVATLVTAALLIGEWAARGGPAPSVPPEYADLYPVLDAKLKSVDAYIAPRWNGSKHDGAFSAELLAANSNQGEQLFRDQAWQAVTLNLDRMQPLGIRGVKVAVTYPILVPAFPRSAQYLEFYKRLSQELKRRNLKFLVQMTAGFREPAFSVLPVATYYTGLTLDRYKQEKRLMAETIIREIRPDYLTIENEPGTQQENTGLTFSVQSVTEIIQHILNGLNRSGVLIGAGAGTWDDLAYTESIARTGVDYIDMHIYPVNRDFLVDRTFKMAEIARRSNKKVVLGEAWLYKVRDNELTGQAVAAAPALFARDVFGFWEPLDIEFLTSMVKLAHYLKIDFTSFFWSRYFFGYVEYGEGTRYLRPPELFRRANMEAAKSMLADPPQFTKTGLAFQRLIKSGP
ncbi:MAG TPA: hypothetical protein VFM39_01600 [bacterium]|nr:hypothetical protein [bacterium]